jgi:23S rRNA pseudouridine2605 synthase
MDADGLMVLTNDGDFAHRLMHPKFSHLRCYQVKIRGELNDTLISKLKEGVRLTDGLAKAKDVEILRKSGLYTWVNMSLYEGRNHLIKRIFEKVRLDVLRIKRVRMGPLSIKGLPVGKYRPFFRKELLALQKERENRK